MSLHFEMSVFIYFVSIICYFLYLLFNCIAFVFVKTNFKIVVILKGSLYVSHNFNSCVNGFMLLQNSIKWSV